MRKTSSFLAIASLALGLSGCASMVDKSAQDVVFSVDGPALASCKLANDDYMYRFQVPAKVNLERHRADLLLTCVAPGYYDFERVVESKINAKVNWNAFNGYVPGAAYDVGTKAAYDFPDRVLIAMDAMELPEPEMVASEMRPVTYVPIEDNLPAPVGYEPIVEEPQTAAEFFEPQDPPPQTAASEADTAVEDGISGRK